MSLYSVGHCQEMPECIFRDTSPKIQNVNQFQDYFPTNHNICGEISEDIYQKARASKILEESQLTAIICDVSDRII